MVYIPRNIFMIVVSDSACDYFSEKALRDALHGNYFLPRSAVEPEEILERIEQMSHLCFRKNELEDGETQLIIQVKVIFCKRKGETLVGVTKTFAMTQYYRENIEPRYAYSMHHSFALQMYELINEYYGAKPDRNLFNRKRDSLTIRK